MRSAELNVTSVTPVTLLGLVPLSDHSSLFFFVFLAAYTFVLCSDALVVYIICSQRSLRRPMFAFVAAVLLNSAVSSSAVYPALLSELLSGRAVAHVSRSACLCQAFVLYSLGGSSFLLLAAMSLDRYLSICRPLRYAALVTPAAVSALLLLCWLLPALLVGGAVLLASRLPLCRARLHRIYCDIYSFVELSCGGRAAALSEVYGLQCSALIVALPVAFVLFSYARILSACLRHSRDFSGKALRTCLPHLLVFLNYSLSAACDLLQRRLQRDSEPAASLVTSVLLLVVPTVMNPVVYGLNVTEIHRHARRLLSCARAARALPPIT